jgi:hypothetical protein
MKKICITREESSGIIGSKLMRKTTFFTKKLLAITLFVPLLKVSAKKNQGIIPLISHKIKGKSSTGFDLKPT